METCIRVFNYRFAVASDYATIYHSIDLTAYLMLITRATVAEVEQGGLFDTREHVQNIVATVLATYRNCVCSTTPICSKLVVCLLYVAQLSLPERLAMLPLYLNALLKSPLLAMTPMNSVAKLEDVYPRVDERAYAKWVRFHRSNHA